MLDQNNNLSYVKKALQAADEQNHYPAIYFLWGCILFAGFAIAEFTPNWLNYFWLVASPTGFIVSAWLGTRKSRAVGQQDFDMGDRYLKHFAVTIVFTFAALLTEEYDAILLIIGIAYCLAGIYLDRNMFWIGALSLAIYIANYFHLIASNLIIGTLFAAGFFLAAWGSVRQNNSNQTSA